MKIHILFLLNVKAGQNTNGDKLVAVSDQHSIYGAYSDKSVVPPTTG
jgi:hypothetical protein